MLLFFLFLLISLSEGAYYKRTGFTDDFSESPGPKANTMGTAPASAMAIGTGSSGPGDYSSNYKTPNYTQYTTQDFKEFMPNYQEMMESSMDKISGSSFGNISLLLKSFMDLQKEQLEVDKAKAEANKAKVNLAMESFDSGKEPLNRKRRAILTSEPLISLSSLDKSILRSLLRLLSLPEISSFVRGSEDDRPTLKHSTLVQLPPRLWKMVTPPRRSRLSRQSDDVNKSKEDWSKWMSKSSWGAQTDKGGSGTSDSSGSGSFSDASWKNYMTTTVSSSPSSSPSLSSSPSNNQGSSVQQKQRSSMWTEESPVHGSVALSSSSSKFSNNIPNLSFSLFPPPPSSVEDEDKESFVKESSPSFPLSSSPSLSYSSSLPYSSPLSSSSLSLTPERNYIMMESDYDWNESPIYLSNSPETPILYRLESRASPMSVVNKYNKEGLREKISQQIVIDPENGIILSKKKGRLTRSVKSPTPPLLNVPFFQGSEKLLKINHHEEERQDKKKLIQFQSSLNSTDSDYDNKRSVKIGFEQKGELSDGASEVISAGGGRSEAHEGGGLSIK